MVTPAVVVAAAATMAPGGMSPRASVAPLLRAGRKGQPIMGVGPPLMRVAPPLMRVAPPLMGVGEQSPAEGRVGVRPVDRVARMGLAERHPAQSEQRHEACQNKSAPLLSRRSSVHFASGGSRVPPSNVGPDPIARPGQYVKAAGNRCGAGCPISVLSGKSEFWSAGKRGRSPGTRGRAPGPGAARSAGVDLGTDSKP